MNTLLSCCQWLEGTATSVYIRESVWTYPIIESTHVLGLCVFIGFLLFWDLRLLGVVLRGTPVSEVWRRLIPWITVGAAIMVLSGVLLFISDPVRFYGNIFFRIKTVGLVLALVNALAFHFGIERQLVNWDTAGSTPRAARLAGGVSIFLWAAIIVCGRLVAYNWFPSLV
jgi:hypothetical protein